jgi:hypothetical protein
MLDLKSPSIRGRLLMPAIAAQASTVATAVARRRVRPPKLELLPAAAATRNGLLASTFLHTAILVLLAWLPILLPVRATTTGPTATDLMREYDYQPLILPALPSMEEPSSGTEIEHESGQKARSAMGNLPGDTAQTFNAPKRDYAGAQTIVSNPPDSIKGVQTIRRPDLVSPPKLVYPLRLPSLVTLPTPAIPAPVTRNLEHPVVPNPRQPSTLRVIEPRIPSPALPIDTLKLSLLLSARPPAPPPAQAPVQPPAQVPARAPAPPVAPKRVVSSESTVPVPAITRPALRAPKAVAVINAVVVPPELAPVIPDAELATRFVVAPSPDATAAVGTASGAGPGKAAGVAASNAAENSPHSSVENGTGNKVDSADAHGEPANVGPPSSAGAPSASGAAGPTSPAPAKALPGISIAGGVSGRGGRGAQTNPNPRGSYGLTIISGGSSGGASRDLGVFSRSEIVYTVYIPMTDVGGGPDCPMQYALLSSGAANNGSLGLLTPPVVQKKVPATAPRGEIGADAGPVFLTGIIDDNGDLQLLRVVRLMDARAQAALNALSQWVFLPAQLDGRAVASKVLIGVTVTPADEVGKN